MRARTLVSAIVVGSLIAGLEIALAAEPPAASKDVVLSPELRSLLRAEMREISLGVQGMALAIAIADWKSIQETGAKIRASYILEKKLTPAQAAELDRALPEEFEQLDADFHDRAEKVGAAAAAHDAELVVFQYSRMLESCAACHAEFAQSRFPDFSSGTDQVHQH